MQTVTKKALRLTRPLVGWCRCASTVPEPQIPACDFKPQPYKGLPYDKVRSIREEHVSPAIQAQFRRPVLIHQGHMQYVWDHEGKRYLDCIGGMITISAGHCHPKVVSALQDQVGRLWHTSPIWLHSGIHEYAEKLVATLPDPLKVVYFVNSGSEANDMALMMARLYTGAFDIISLRHGYHGGSPQTLGLMGMDTWRFKIPTAFGIHQTMNPDVYRGVWGGDKCRDSPVQADRPCDCAPGECKACSLYVDQLDEVLRHSTPKDGIAGFFIEPIQGGGGTTQYPKNYMKKAFELIRAKGGLCIADEVQTAFGRTGTDYWAFQGHGAMPDIVTTAKGIGNGFPLAAVITTPKIAASLGRALHFNTFGGNPLACAVGSKVLDVIEEDGLQENCHVIGTYLLTELAKLRSEFDIVGDVRGKGYLIGVELVRDKASRKPIDKDTFNDIHEALKDHGILAGKGGLEQNVFRLKGPMCLTMADAEFIVAVFRKVLTDHKARNN